MKEEKQIKLEYYRNKYLRSNRKVKQLILDELIQRFKYHRKHAVRLMSKKSAGRPKNKQKAGRKSIYSCSRFVFVLTKIWKYTDFMCSKLLKEVMQDWVESYEQHHGVLESDVKIKLLKISPASMDRILKKVRKEYGKGKSGTKPGTMLRNEIPIRNGIWEEQKPGFVEADTVAHCGGSLQGDFFWSLTLTDIATGWTECRATWNKGASGVLEQIKDIEHSLPFELLGFDCDNGSEFLNNYLLKYFTEQKPKHFSFTRSRPYHKDDNAHVEQKNWSHVRQLLGYQRLDSIELKSLINDLYKNDFSLLRNHFYPTFKLDDKIMIKTRHKRIYGKPVTPYQRVLDSKYIHQETKDNLTTIHNTLDPINLQINIQKKLKSIFDKLKHSSNLSQFRYSRS